MSHLSIRKPVNTPYTGMFQLCHEILFSACVNYNLRVSLIELLTDSIAPIENAIIIKYYWQLLGLVHVPLLLKNEWTCSPKFTFTEFPCSQKILLHVPLIPKNISHHSPQFLPYFTFSWLVIFIAFTSLVIVQTLLGKTPLSSPWWPWRLSCSLGFIICNFCCFSKSECVIGSLNFTLKKNEVFLLKF